MKLLFVTPYVPSPIRVRPYQFLRHLAKQGVSIILVTLDDGTTAPEIRAELNSLCAAVHYVPLKKREAALRCLAALPTPTPLWVAYCRTREFTAQLATLVQRERFDAAHVEHLRAAFVAPALGTLPTVFDAVDCITALQKQFFSQSSSLPKKLLAGEEWLKLRRYEARAYAPFAELTVTSAFDAEALHQLGVRPRVTVIPNGVDLEYFQPQGTPDADTLVFSGKMSYGANDDAARYFVRDILPCIRAKRPQVKLILAGSEPSAAVQALAAADPQIQVTGYVPDLRPYIAQAAVAVCPLRIGVGIQNKALEAMAMGRPVVCSPIAARAIPEARHGGGVTVADDPEHFAAACLDLLLDSSGEGGRSARNYVERHHRWDCAATQLQELYRSSRRSFETIG